MLEYADFAYQTGLVDIHGKHAMKLFELLAKEYFPSFESKIVSTLKQTKTNLNNLNACHHRWLFIVLGHNAVCIYSEQQL